MFFFKKKSAIVAVCNGTIHPLTEFPDEAIAQKMLGDGYYVEPSDGTIVSPMEGEIVMVFPTGHAVGIKSKEYELLVHIGVDTVVLNGKGFTNKVSVGDRVKAGQVLVEVDLINVKNSPEVKALSTAVLFTGSDKQITVLNPGSTVSAGQPDILTIQ